MLAPLEERSWALALDQFGLSREPMMAVAANGTFVMANRSGAALYFFDQEGLYRFSRGRFGVGFGDFRGIDRLEYLAFADRFAAFDFAAGAISIFKPDGELVRILNHPVGVVSGAAFPNPQSSVYLKVDRESPHAHCGVFRYDFENDKEFPLHILTGPDHVSLPLYCAPYNGDGEPWCQNLWVAALGSTLALKLPRENVFRLRPLTGGMASLAETAVPEYLQQGAALLVDEPMGRFWLWKQFGQAYVFQGYDLALKPVGKGHFPSRPLATLGDWAYLLQQEPGRPTRLLRKPLPLD